ncbi:hypothetical protein P692DRAFT_201729417 [Suillus brevipes Sb2]|nr:hypothetical protein P692DRAFT_201729417 [Suillus brevipes Sb2]
MWDDLSPHWGGESVLTIGGHPIPLMYWPDVYRYGKTCQWQGTKSRWTEWRDVVTRYRQSTVEDFWKEFSVDGSNMTFTAIVAELRRQRKNDKQDLVARAHQEYGDTFDSNFSYRKGNDTLIMTDPSAICRRYKQLQLTKV